MPHRKKDHKLRLDVTTGHIAAVSKVDQPFPELVRHVFNMAACAGLLPERFHFFPHGLDNAFCRFDVLVALGMARYDLAIPKHQHRPTRSRSTVFNTLP